MRVVHPVDAGVVLNPVDQWDCPRDSFLYRIEAPGISAGLLVRSSVVVEAAPQLKQYVGKSWLNFVVPDMLRRGWRAKLLKDNTHARINVQ